jgi:hypothetical protein
MQRLPNETTLRRMTLEQLISKLEQIEQQAQFTIREYPGTLALDRQRLIIGLARQLQIQIQDQLRGGARDPLANAAVDEPVRQSATGTQPIDAVSHKRQKVLARAPVGP